MQGSSADLHGRAVTKTLLNTLIVVKMDIICNCSSKRGFISKFVQIEHLGLYDVPETLSGTVVNAVSNTGHGLLHLLPVQLHLKGGTGILESSVAVKQRSCLRISRNRFVKSAKHQLIVIMAAQLIGDDGAVIQIQNCAELKFVAYRPIIPFNVTDRCPH